MRHSRRIIIAIAITIGAYGLASQAPASAANCGPGYFNGLSTKYNCQGGSKFSITSPYGTPNNPLGAYNGRDSSGNRYNCRYDAVYQGYFCSPRR